MSAQAHAPVLLDIAGTSLSTADRRRLQHPLTGGLILFSRNFGHRAQLTRLCAEIKALRPDALIAVDHEGGRVQRFSSDGFTPLPAMRRLGELWMQDAMAAVAAARACGYVLASELRACGVDFSFAPVLDLDHGPSAVIGDRAFHRDARVVALLAQSLMLGLLQAGVQACGKHFPGHGHVAADSHHEIPVDRRSLKAILADDAAPYRWLAGSMASLMPAHVVYPKVDSRPAGFSKRWLQDILREQLGFGGAIFSDDLLMAGATRLDGRDITPTEGGVAALQAGCDLVLICNASLQDDGAAIDALLDGLQAAQADGLWSMDADSEARRLALLPRTEPLAWDELMHQAAYCAALELLP